MLWLLLLFVLIAPPIWYHYVFIPRMRLAAFKEVVDDLNPYGPVAFIDETGADAFGLVSEPLSSRYLRPIRVSESVSYDDKKKLQGTQTVRIQRIGWAGMSTFHVEAALYFSSEICSGAKYAFLVSLFDCKFEDALSHWSKGELPPIVRTGHPAKVMPRLQTHTGALSPGNVK